MKTRAPLLGNASSFLLPIGTALSAAAIFVGDLSTDRTVCVATLFVVVVLMAGGFCRPRGVWLVAAGCAGLTVLDLLLSHETIPNTLISLAAIGLTAFSSCGANKRTWWCASRRIRTDVRLRLG